MPSELQLNDTWFRSLVEHVRDYAIVMVTPEGRIASWNTGAQALKGYSESEILGQPYAQFFTDEDRRAGKPAALLNEAQLRGSVEDQGWRVRKDGSRFWALAVVTAVQDEHGALLGFAKVTRDLTERRLADMALAEHAHLLQAANEELMAQQEELSAQQDALRLANERLQQLDAHKDHFFSTMSHELRTPMNAILGFTEVLLSGMLGDPLSAKQRNALERVLKNAKNLLGLIDDLLDLARMQAGSLSITLVPLDLKSLCVGTVDSLQGLAERKHQPITCVIEAALPPILADAQRVSQVLINLINNAIKFSPEHGRIELRAFLQDSCVRCEVVDQGIGIAPADFALLFQRFGQLEAGQTPGVGGTGLGLSICKVLVEAQGGAIGLESQPGRGSTFWFTLPVAKTT